jgi:hypothetical protein
MTEGQGQFWPPSSASKSCLDFSEDVQLSCPVLEACWGPGTKSAQLLVWAAAGLAGVQRITRSLAEMMMDSSVLALRGELAACSSSPRKPELALSCTAVTIAPCWPDSLELYS